MARIDRLHTLSPFFGSRKSAIVLGTPEAPVNRKRVQRLTRVMGPETLYRRPRAPVPGRDHKVYPHLLRNAAVERPNQVWSAEDSLPANDKTGRTRRPDRSGTRSGSRRCPRSPPPGR